MLLKPSILDYNQTFLAEIFAFAVTYGLYLTLSTIVLVNIILETSFFQDKFGVDLECNPGVPLVNVQRSYTPYDHLPPGCDHFVGPDLHCSLAQILLYGASLFRPEGGYCHQVYRRP